MLLIIFRAQLATRNGFALDNDKSLQTYLV